MASKCTKYAENVYAPLVMVSIVARKRTLAGKTVFINGSLDSSPDLPPFSLVDLVPLKRRRNTWRLHQTIVLIRYYAGIVIVLGT